MSGASPHITVLMPAYNAAACIAEAVESILCQTYPWFELLIIDDASTDATREIVRSFCDPRVRLVENDCNTGIPSVLNKGIALSRYELIARMDADDISHPWRLEKQVAYMLENPDCAMVSSRVRVMDAQKRVSGSDGLHNWHLYYSLVFECCIYHPAVLFRRSCVLATGAYQSGFSEDYDLFWRLSRRYKVGSLDEPLLYYRTRPENTNLPGHEENYDTYNRQHWDRNLRYYLGEQVSLPESYRQCYCYRFQPLLEEGGPETIYDCLTWLDKISAAILSVENPNRNPDYIRFISNYKRQYIIRELAVRSPFLKMWRLLLHYRRRRMAVKLTLKRIGHAFKPNKEHS